MTVTRESWHWDLWLLRALHPAAQASDLERVLHDRARWAAHQRDLPARLLAGDPALTAAGRALLAGDPALRSGVLLTLRLGPCLCLLEPFLAAGLPVAVLADEPCMARWRRPAADLERRLGRRGLLTWSPFTDPGAADLLDGHRELGGPLVVFADAAGQFTPPGDGRRSLLAYRLPGREIRLPASLARRLCRCEAAVHPITVRWSADGLAVVWSRQATQGWSRRQDPREVARLLYDWVFHEASVDPAQWSGWRLLVDGVLEGAGEAGLTAGEIVPTGLRADYRRALDLCLDRAASLVTVELEAALAVWPGGILADLTHDRFYDAGGLRPADLAIMSTGRPTLAQLVARRGRRWVQAHVQRLCLLGLARLGAPDG